MEEQINRMETKTKDPSSQWDSSISKNQLDKMQEYEKFLEKNVQVTTFKAKEYPSEFVFVCLGMCMDSKSNLYFSDLARQRIVVVNQSKELLCLSCVVY